MKVPREILAAKIDLEEAGWERKLDKGALMWCHPYFIDMWFTFKAALDADEQLTRESDDAIAELDRDLDRALTADHSERRKAA